MVNARSSSEPSCVALLKLLEGNCDFNLFHFTLEIKQNRLP